jgi:hypothetical protein
MVIFVIGLHEECSQADAGFTSDSTELDHKTLLQKLESENELLKLQLRQLQQGNIKFHTKCCYI